LPGLFRELDIRRIKRLRVRNAPPKPERDKE